MQERQRDVWHISLAVKENLHLAFHKDQMEKSASPTQTSKLVISSLESLYFGLQHSKFSDGQKINCIKRHPGHRVSHNFVRVSTFFITTVNEHDNATSDISQGVGISVCLTSIRRKCSGTSLKTMIIKISCNSTCCHFTF